MRMWVGMRMGMGMAMAMGREASGSPASRFQARQKGTLIVFRNEIRGASAQGNA